MFWQKDKMDEPTFSIDAIRQAASRLARRIEWKRLADHLPDALVLADIDDGRIVMVNTEAVSLFDYTESEMLGQPVEMFMPEEYRQTHATVHRPAFARNPLPRMMGMGRDLYIQTKKGTRVQVEIAVRKMVEEEGSFVVTVIRRKG